MFSLCFCVNWRETKCKRIIHWRDDRPPLGLRTVNLILVTVTVMMPTENSFSCHNLWNWGRGAVIHDERCKDAMQTVQKTARTHIETLHKTFKITARTLHKQRQTLHTVPKRRLTCNKSIRLRLLYWTLEIWCVISHCASCSTSIWCCFFPRNALYLICLICRMWYVSRIT